MRKSEIFKFLVVSILIYLVLVFVGSVEHINYAIGEIFRNINNAHFDGLLEDTRVKFVETCNSGFDTSIHIKYENSRQWNFAEFRMDSWYTAYIPNILYISLSFATIFSSLQKKLWAIISGIVLTNFFSHAILLVRVCTLTIQVKSSMGDFDNTFSDKLVIFLHNNIAVYGWITFLIPVFSWLIIAVVFRTTTIKLIEVSKKTPLKIGQI